MMGIGLKGIIGNFFAAGLPDYTPSSQNKSAYHSNIWGMEGGHSTKESERSESKIHFKVEKIPFRLDIKGDTMTCSIDESQLKGLSDELKSKYENENEIFKNVLYCHMSNVYKESEHQKVQLSNYHYKDNRLIGLSNNRPVFYVKSLDEYKVQIILGDQDKIEKISHFFKRDSRKGSLEHLIKAVSKKAAETQPQNPTTNHNYTKQQPVY